MNTTFVSNACKLCGCELITFDKRYDLPPCNDFILVCPEHPAEVIFDLSPEELREIAESEEL